MNKSTNFAARIRRSQPRSLTQPGAELVTQSFAEGTALPLVLTPQVTDVNLLDWASHYQAELEEALLQYGALLFRGFGIREVADFSAFARVLCPELFGEYGDLPSEDKSAKVYKSTPYPNDKKILFHNESSHMDRWPARQFFCSVKVASEGGETPLVDCNRLYRQLDPELARRFREKGLLYQRNFIPGMDVSWQDYFKAERREEVEAACERAGYSYRWLGADGLCLYQKAPAVLKHPITGEWSFFNQIQLHHLDFLDPEARASLLRTFSEQELPRNVYFGDGTPISSEITQEITRLYEENAVSLPWEEGDVIVLDNLRVAHARNPFVGERKVIVAMGKMVYARDLIA